MPDVLIHRHDASYGLESRNRLGEASLDDIEGARAALESFYFAFNQRDLETLAAGWHSDPLVQLNNPLGGIRHGRDEIVALYRKLFDGPARVWVEFYDIVEYVSTGTVVFAGRERGEYAGSETISLAIRTTRIFMYGGPTAGWRQTHHHGSIDDAHLLGRYQTAVRA